VENYRNPRATEGESIFKHLLELNVQFSYSRNK